MGRAERGKDIQIRGQSQGTYRGHPVEFLRRRKRVAGAALAKPEPGRRTLEEASGWDRENTGGTIRSSDKDQGDRQRQRQQGEQ